MGGNISKEELEKTHVVIIGGGYAGMELGIILRKWKIPFTIIDIKEYFHHIVGGLRAVINPDFSKRVMIPFKPTFGDKFIQGKVTSVDLKKKQVTIDNGQTIHYTDLVIAVGSSGSFFDKVQGQFIEDAEKFKKELSDEIDRASKIIVVGGGAIGIEMAGEIAQKYPEKKITIIHSNSKLASQRLGEPFQRNVKALIKSYNIETKLEERVSNMNELNFGECKKQTVTTDKGHSYECDIVLKCTGMYPQTSLTGTIFDSSRFDERHLLKVSPELMVIGEENVYAIGDCCDTPEEKLAAYCEFHAETVAWNIWNSIKNKSKIQYKTPFNGMIITMGPWSGVGMINGWNVPSIICGIFKGRNLFTSQQWKAMGQKEPC